jgi:hypothetical protein
MTKVCSCGSATCPICKGKNASVSAVVDGNVLVTFKPGAIEVPCACGCGKMVKVGPVYFSSACRSRAWRKRRG